MADPCKYCGECLSRCAYLRLDRDEAGREMRRLDEGLGTLHIDSGCTSCFACNAFCPNNADPYGRILERLHRKYLERGLPERARYMMPTEGKSFRTDAVAALPEDERRMVEQWARTEPEGDVLYPGCNLITAPYLVASGILDGLTISGSLDQCCGEMYFRMGLLDQARRMAERLSDYYAGKKIERMVFVCAACYNMFANVMPQRFGARFDFETTFFTDYLIERIKSGRISLPRKKDLRAVVHDSCHARVLGPGFMDRVRELATMLGISIVEVEHSREDGWCCGIAAGAMRQSPVDVISVASRAHREYRRSRADSILTYCTGCYLTLGMLRPPASFGPHVRHILELLGEAAGKPVPDRLGRRKMTMLGGIVRNALPKMLSKKRFRIE